MWLGFLGLVAGLLAFDLGVLHRKDREIGGRESLLLSAFYIVIGLGFGGLVVLQLGGEAGLEYVTAFVVEKSLAVDNLFVIATIFSFLAIPRAYQYRVLFWGVLGVIILRAIMIGLGAALVSQFDWVLYIFAIFLILTGAKMLFSGAGEIGGDLEDNRIIRFVKRRTRVTDQLHGHSFFVREPDEKTGRAVLVATPLFLALVVIEVADIVFAVDSVPAVFAITTDPYLVYTSNIFAILGLRALYFGLAAVMHRFAYLKTALAILLMFVGAKIFIADVFGWEKFPAAWSLTITFAILAAGILFSVWRTRGASPATDTSTAGVVDRQRPVRER
jgi:tellurite resistance protein TerC